MSVGLGAISDEACQGVGRVGRILLSLAFSMWRSLYLFDEVVRDSDFDLAPYAARQPRFYFFSVSWPSFRVSIWYGQGKARAGNIQSRPHGYFDNFRPRLIAAELDAVLRANWLLVREPPLPRSDLVDRSAGEDGSSFSLRVTGVLLLRPASRVFPILRERPPRRFGSSQLSLRSK